MDRNIIARRLARLIAARSYSGFEIAALKEFEEIASSLNEYKERIFVAENRYNLFYSVGVPKVVFTSHIDVVSGDDELFAPLFKDQSLVGRGACDAKGSLIAMLSAVEELVRAGQTGFGFLVVVGEEDDGIGAKLASSYLKDRGISIIINGEPTQNYLAENSGGVFDFVCKFKGRAAHSGYREYGEDANNKLLATCLKIKALSFEELSDVGVSSINLGFLSGGNSGNTVSPTAELRGCVRTFSYSNNVPISLIKSCVVDGSFDVYFDCPFMDLCTVPGFETVKVSFASDIPNFKELNCRYLMYGPGSILDAHTNYERIGIEELERAVEDYVRLYFAVCEEM